MLPNSAGDGEGGGGGGGGQGRVLPNECKVAFYKIDSLVAPKIDND